MARPDLLLADMITILHPELLPDHKLIWYLHLPPTMSKGGADTKSPSNNNSSTGLQTR